jgi:hypothetical protein
MLTLSAKPGPALSSVSITCLNSSVSQSKPAIWSSIPAQCRLRHPWQPGTVAISWEHCECAAAQQARGGHIKVACGAPG